MQKKTRLIITFTPLLLILLSAIPLGVRAASSTIDYVDLISKIDMDEIRTTVQYLSSLDSRVTGYPGFEETAEYVINQFKSLGYAVKIQEFPALVPMERYASLKILPNGRTIKLHMLWPNLVQTCSIPPEGLTGHIIYGENGELEDFNGKPVNNSIVLMSFNSFNNWINAFRLGAKAIIYIEPTETTRLEAEAKITAIPIWLPRFYMFQEDAAYLLELLSQKSEVYVNLTARMEYTEVTAKNIYVEIEGTTFPDDIILIGAHYDTWSVVPAIAPGADEATSIATLLQIAKIIKENPPARTVWLTALAGHWESLAGARHFVEEHIFGESAPKNRKIWAYLDLEFSTDSNTIVIQWMGDFYSYPQAGRIAELYRRIWNVYLPDIEFQLKKSIRNDVVDYTPGAGQYAWPNNFIPMYRLLDSEAFAIAGPIGISFRTSRGFRFTWGHPLSKFNTVNFEWLKPQLEASFSIIFSLLNDPEPLPISWDIASPTRGRTAPAEKEGGGFVILKGIVSFYDMRTGWYKSEFEIRPLIHVLLPRAQPQNPLLQFIELADKNGSFTIAGMPHAGVYAYSQAASWMRNEVRAYVVNFTSGQIIYAPDQGQYGAQAISPFLTVISHPIYASPIVFRCSSIVISDIWDVRTSWLPSMPYQSLPISLQVYDINTMAPLDQFNVLVSTDHLLAQIFAPLGKRIAVMFTAGTERGGTIRGLIVNSTQRKPLGEGMPVRDTETHVTMTILRFAEDLWKLSNDRYRRIRGVAFRSYAVEEALNNTNTALENTYHFLQEYKYDLAYAQSIVAWASSLRAYTEDRLAFDEITNTTFYFFMLLLPFSLLVESILFTGLGKKRFFTIASIFALSLLVLSLQHPGYRLASNVWIVMLSMVSLILSAITLYVLASGTAGLLAETREKVLGKHFATISRGSAALLSFSVGVNNMRKRKFQTMLVLITFILTITSMVSLTSISYATKINPINMAGTGAYEGIVLKIGEADPGNFISERLRYIAMGFAGEGSIVSYRAGYYPPVFNPNIGPLANIEGKNSTYGVFAFLGLVPEEDEITSILSTYIVEGRPFIKEDTFAVMLTKRQSEVLGVKSGDTIRWASIKFMVVGIVEGEALNLFKDLNQKSLTPLTPTLLQEFFPPGSQRTEAYVPLPFDQILIVPYRFLHSLGGEFGISVAVKSPKLDEVAQQFSKYLDVPVIMSQAGRLQMFSRTLAVQMTGWTFLSVPIVIVAFSLFNILLGTVHSRVREIHTYSSVGLSPIHIVFLFLAESLVYSVVGVMLGYMIGMTVNTFIMVLGLMPPGLYPNFGSIFIIIAISVAFLISLISVTYPMIKASKLVTPSLERKWKIPTSPIGDSWNIPLPLSASSEEEVYGIIVFFDEYMRAHTMEMGKTFMVLSSKPRLQEKRLELSVSLSPFEAGVSQDVMLTFFEDEKGRYHLNCILHHTTGLREVWMTSNRAFLNELRKQLLIWRSLTSEDITKYIKTAKTIA